MEQQSKLVNLSLEFFYKRLEAIYHKVINNLAYLVGALNKKKWLSSKKKGKYSIVFGPDGTAK